MIAQPMSSMKFVKRPKPERDVNVALEVAAELFSSRVGRKLSLPVPEVYLERIEGDDFALLMDLLEERRGRVPNNVRELGASLPFEEWILNVDLKEEHVMLRGDEGMIVDHGHSLSAWKPLYYIMELNSRPVTRFDLWADESSISEGLEILNSVDLREVELELRRAMREVLDAGFCNLFSPEVMEDHIKISTWILKERKFMVPKFYDLSRKYIP
jgi:hypothetical protein